MDIYFENIIWTEDGKIHSNSPVRWVDSQSGTTNFGDYKTFSEKWDKFSLGQGKNIRLFLASKQLMSVRKKNNFKFYNISPISFLDYFPSIYKLIYKKPPNFFFDCSGKLLNNFNNVLNDLDIKNSKVYSLGLGINWERDVLTIYPSKSLITIRYGFYDFVSFSIKNEIEKSLLDEELNILINSLGTFKKIKIIHNNGHEELIENSLSNFQKELVALKTNHFLPELIIDQSYQNTQKTFYRLFNLIFNNFCFFLKFPNLNSLLAPITISFLGVIGIFLYDGYVETISKKPPFYNRKNISINAGSLIFLNNFINQSKILTTKNVKSIELDVKQKLNNMVGFVKVVLDSESVENNDVMLDGVSKLANDVKFERHSSTLISKVNYPYRKSNHVKNQSEIITLMTQLLKNSAVKDSIKTYQVTAQSAKKVKVILKNQQISKINSFLLSLKEKPCGWDWISLKFIKRDLGLTSFYGTFELLEEK